MASMLISGHMHAEDRALAAVVRKSLDIAGQLDEQCDRDIVDPFHLDDADAADFELAGDGRRSRSDEPLAILA